MLNEPLVSIILPVYNHQQYLQQSIDSVLTQTYQNWELIIADDCSSLKIQKLLEPYRSLPKARILRNKKNLGLFPNLNQAIRQSKGLYVILLCSDDFLLPHCLDTSVNLIEANSGINMILTAFSMVNNNGIEIPSGSMYYHNLMISNSLQQLQPRESVPLLLKWGSINGNLTGMCFTREIFEQVGGFREEWKHAGDWEWVYRVCAKNDILLSKIPIATVRSHDEQLSGVNFRNISNSLEVIEMVRILLNDPYIIKMQNSKSLALFIMQYHLWFALKFSLQGRFRDALKITNAISKVTGFNSTLWALIKWLPNRWERYTGKINFPVPID